MKYVITNTPLKWVIHRREQSKELNNRHTTNEKSQKKVKHNDLVHYYYYVFYFIVKTKTKYLFSEDSEKSLIFMFKSTKMQ